MRFLVCGSKGMLGSTLFLKLQDAGHHVYGFNEKILSSDGVPCDLGMYDAVFNCIGAIPQKKPNLDSLIWANIVIPRLLARTAKKLVHFSTDCVFAGNVGNYVHDAGDWATDDYGWSKRNGEVLNDPKIIVVRTSIIGHRGALGLFDWFLHGNHPKGADGVTYVKGFTNHFWNGLTTNELGSIIVNNTDFFTQGQGLLQIGGERVSKFELLNLVNEVYNKGIHVLPADTEIQVDKSLISNIVNPNFWMLKSLKQQLQEMRMDEISWGLYK